MEKNDIYYFIIYRRKKFFMILTRNIIINITNRNIKHYKNIHQTGEAEISIEELHKGSHTKIHVKCDICERETNISYREYNKSISNGDYYSCSPNCAKNKNKITNLEKYGVENVAMLHENEIKRKNTCTKKYGVDTYLKTQEKQEKSKITSINKYGVESPNQSEIVKNNKKNSFISKYNVENPSQIKEVKEKKTNIFINSYFAKYGTLPDERRLKMRSYRNKIKKLTNKNKKKLLEIWNGYDFYDGEYIRENFNLSYINKNYPTIDHKISVYYGFMNDISPEEISKIENLCFTKRTLNSIKQEKCYEGKEKS